MEKVGVATGSMELWIEGGCATTDQLFSPCLPMGLLYD
jgi:hypothetical protein